MLKLLKITKVYPEKPPVTALEDVNLEFPSAGFVSVLGPSGCGKTTLLNIIGGLDTYDGGDLVINDVHTAAYTAKDWDAYRNNYIGFVFQGGNLIEHLSIWENIALPLRLSGAYNAEKVKAVIKETGLEEHLNKPVSHLSGGEKQRVDIARALINDPHIILADEPVASLDETAKHEIMQILQNISKTRLVILVTHNKAIAKEYSERIITLDKGKVVKDEKTGKNVSGSRAADTKQARKGAMGFGTTSLMAFKNLLAKRFRTIVSTFAMTLGILSLSLVLALTNGFGQYISQAREDQYGAPIVVTANDDKSVISHLFTNYIENPATKLSPETYNGIRFDRAMELNLFAENKKMTEAGSTSINGISVNSGKALNFQEINNNAIFENFYETIAGRVPSNKNEIVLILDEYNKIDKGVMRIFGWDAETEYSDIIGSKFLWIPNNTFYTKVENEFKSLIRDYGLLAKQYCDAPQTYGLEDLTIVGVFKSQDVNNSVITAGFGYTFDFTNYVINSSKNSLVVASRASQAFTDASEKSFALSTLGADDGCTSISIFARDLDAAATIKEYIDNFNSKFQSERVSYIDNIAGISRLVGGISRVLISVAVISLIIAGLLLAIITYITVQERTGEIAVMRAVGARKLNIALMIILETAFIGLLSGIVGSLFGFAFAPILNATIGNAIGITNVVKFTAWQPIVLIITAMAVTILSGLIPAIRATRKDPAKILRSDV